MADARVNQSSARWKVRTSSCRACRTAHSTNKVRPICIPAYASANISPRSAKAFGMAAASTSPASISANTHSRTGTRAGSSQLVDHEVYIQTHHTAGKSSAVCAAPCRLRFASSPCESCVIANTNTRSKNSSTMPTRPLSWSPRFLNKLVIGQQHYQACRQRQRRAAKTPSK